MVLERPLLDTLDCQKDGQVGPSESQDWNVAGGKNGKLNVSYFRNIMRKQGSLEKTIMMGHTEGSKKREDQIWEDWLYERSHRPESTGAEQGCWTGHWGHHSAMGSSRVGVHVACTNQTTWRVHYNYKMIDPSELFMAIILALFSATTDISFSHLDWTAAKGPCSHLDSNDNNVTYMFHALYVNICNPDSIPTKYYFDSINKDI